MKTFPAVLAAASLVVVAASARANTLLVDLSPYVNSSWVGLANPVGFVVLGGVPFDIASDNVGYAAVYSTAFSPSPETLTIPVSLHGAKTVYTLMNTNWGESGAFQSITFKATGGLSYTKLLYGGVDIRDWNNDGFTNTINGTTTVQVWSDGPQHREDRPMIVLPSAFYSQTLLTVTFTDLGNDLYGPYEGPNASRLLLNGLTIMTGVPEPQTWALLVGGLGMIGFALRRRRSAAMV